MTATSSPARVPPVYTALPHPVGTPQPVRQATRGGMPGSTGITDASFTTVCRA